jgi:myo-inositol-1-phosphate synthase
MPEKVRVAVVGVGNCACSLVQGTVYYKDDRPGLIRRNVGPYGPDDIQFSVAFDVDRDKVGKRLDEAIFAGQNNTLRFTDVPKLEARVLPAPVLDGVGRHYSEKISTVDGDPADVPKVLRDSHTDVVVNYLPVGSKEATQWWAARSLEAGCAFVNCIPEFIACDEGWQKRFGQANLPLIGDDVKSQFGATIVHRVLARLMASRGIKLERTYQLNFGGNMDFCSMLDSERLTTKRASKRNSVEAEIPHAIGPRNIHISPSDYVEWLDDRKWCYIRIEGTAFGGAPLNLELKLEVWDSPNSAGVVIDSVRFAKLAKDHGRGGVLSPVCSVYMKSPPVQICDEEAVDNLEQWLTETA